MKTILKSFCSQFSSQLDPFLSTLDPAIGSLSGKSREEGLDSLNTIVAKLRDVQNRSRTLQEKIANQHTYLLIFGPLKSGKSTLMNAISGAYVSEVSCLPTYPALVYVQDGEKNRFQATTYESSVREFADSVEMKAAIQQDHAHLASAILQAEKTGEEFDPARHHPGAIRRVDVELPAPNLAESGTVLVDTPGLYSRMKFGYDQMTKDFRDTAACAIFVVKTDDLFFEKVFEEFEELLGCFSRIFLVSNIDSSKQDLQPDGTLNVSLEGSDPDKVIEAFRSLSVSAPLQEAIDNGRLNIYSIDLLKAASRRLSARAQASATESEQSGDSVAETEVSAEFAEPEVTVEFEEADEPLEFEESTGSADPDEGAVSLASEEADSPQPADDGFDTFLEDLTSYLNSSDYLSDFVTDTLRTANGLIQEEVQAAASEISRDIEASTKELNATIYEARHRVDALAELQKTDWTASFAHLDEEKERLFEGVAEGHAERGEALQKILEDWLQTDESWHDLFDKHVNPLLQEGMQQDQEQLLERLRSLLDGSSGGARFSTTLNEKMSQSGLSLEKTVREQMQELGQNVKPRSPQLNTQIEDVPLKQSFMDKLLFRNGIKVRQQFFGTEGELSIAAARKQKRLEGAGVDYIRELLGSFVSKRMVLLEQEYVDGVLGQYVARCCDSLRNEVTRLTEEIGSRIKASEKQLAARQETLDELAKIRQAAELFSGSLTGIEAEFREQVAADDGADSLSVADEAGEEFSLEETGEEFSLDEPNSDLDSDDVLPDWQPDDENEDASESGPAKSENTQLGL